MNKKPWFYRLFLSYFPIFIILNSMLVIIFFTAANHIMQNQFAKSNEIFVRQVQQSVDQILRSVDGTIINEVQNSKELDEYLNHGLEENNPLINYAASNKLMQLKTGFVNSIYIYRAEDGMVLTPVMMINKESFLDKKFIDDSMANSSMFFWSDVRTYNTLEVEVPNTEVVSLVRKIPLVSGGKGIIVINVSMGSIKDMIKNMIDVNMTEINIYNKTGKLILSSNDNIKKINIAASTVSDSTGWKFSSSTKYGELFQVNSFISYLSFAAVLIIIIASIVWTAFVSRRNYKPVEEILDQVRDFTQQNNSDTNYNRKIDEFKVIKSAFQNLIEKSKDYEKQKEESGYLMRKHFFKELVEGNVVVDWNIWREKSKEFDLIQGFSTCYVVVIEIDKYFEFRSRFNDEDRNLLKYALENVISEISANKKINSWAEWITDSRQGVLFMSSGENKLDRNLVVSICEETRLWIHSNWVFDISVGIGTEVNHIEQINHSYSDALTAIEHRVILGGNQVIGCWEIHTSSQEKIAEYLQFGGRMIQTLRAGDSAWESYYNKFFDGLKNCMNSREDIVKALEYLIYYLYQETMGLATESQQIFTNGAIPDMQMYLKQFDTFEDIYVKYLEILRDAYSSLTVLNENRKMHSVAQDIKKYIEENYYDSNLSLAQLSSKFNINASYLSLLFKEELGEKFTEYLIGVRMEHAKQLLTNSNDSVEQIANKVGYNLSISFIRVFKKIVGTTPGDYRNQNQTLNK